MKYSFLGFGLLTFGMIGLFLIVMFESVTVNNESSYYVLKEAMQASMYESIDWTYFSTVATKDNKGEYKIIEQKFVENFTRRFAASINGDSNQYTLEFYDIMEKPPKATVVIKSRTDTYSTNNGTIIKSEENIVNNLTGILEEYEDSE